MFLNNLPYGRKQKRQLKSGSGAENIANTRRGRHSRLVRPYDYYVSKISCDESTTTAIDTGGASFISNFYASQSIIILCSFDNYYVGVVSRHCIFYKLLLRARIPYTCHVFMYSAVPG